MTVNCRTHCTDGGSLFHRKDDWRAAHIERGAAACMYDIDVFVRSLFLCRWENQMLLDSANAS
jgi:hypothetical protein